MPNSTASMSMLIQILDGLGATNQPLFNHQVPPVQYSGQAQQALSQNTSSAYITLPPGTTYTIFNDPPLSPFLFVRNAGIQGVVSLAIVSAQNPSQGSNLCLTPGGVFFFGNNSFLTTNGGNYLNSAILTVLGTSPVIVEYVFGV